MKKMSIKYIYLILIGVATFLVTSWTLRENFYFLFDDIAWIKEVKFEFDLKNFFTILPQSRYNDRPVRTFFFWVLYQLFELDYTKYYLVVLIWHVVNTYMLLSIVYIVLNRINYIKAFECACICALMFGMYPKNLMAVYWIAGAANDLVCTFFSLVVLLLYLGYMKNRKMYFAMLGSLVAYILAMRSKEAAICLPLIILIYECYMTWYQKRKFKLYLGNVLLIGYMLLYLVRIFTLPVGLTAAGQYEQKFSLLTIFKVLLNYIRMYFGLDDSAFSYTIEVYYTKIGELGIVIIGIIVMGIIFRVVTKKKVEQVWGIVAIFISAGLSLAPLVVLPNIQHLLYFYFPAIFLSMLFGILIFWGLGKIHDKFKYVNSYAIVLVLLVIVNNVGGAARLRADWVRYGEEALSATEDIKNIESLAPGYHLYIDGAAVGANVFNYSPGYIVNILYDNKDIYIELIDEETKYEKPYAIWQYSAGHVEEVERVEK